MYLIEKELRDQFAALTNTVGELKRRRGEIEGALRGVRSLAVLGCGSSYSLAKSAALQYAQITGVPAWSAAAGDLLVNFYSYRRMLRGATVLVLSRSGSTSEAVRAAQRCREELGCRVLSLCAREGTPMEEVADWSFCIPWAFDEAVCQTRTVTNLYAAALGMAYIAAGDEEGLASLDGLQDRASAFCPAQEKLLADLAGESWERVVVLGDSGSAGLLEEGALAFKEICRRDSNHYHVLDVRHGPMVQVGPDTLVIALVSSGDRGLQRVLLEDVNRKAGYLLTMDCAPGGSALPGLHISLPPRGGDDVRAIFALYCIQVLCYHHALRRGVDPDKPEGLDAWIKL